jgi:hypothetical protein
LWRRPRPKLGYGAKERRRRRRRRLILFLGYSVMSTTKLVRTTVDSVICVT